MKKLLCLLTAACLMSTLVMSASAADSLLLDPLELTAAQGEFIQTEEESTLLPIDLTNPDDLTPEDIMASESHTYEAQPRYITGQGVCKPEYLNVFPLFYSNGQIYYANTGYRFAPRNEYTHIRGELPLSIQQALFKPVIDAGYTPIGWYLQGSYYMYTYAPLRFEYYRLDHDGTSSLIGSGARNGSNVFEFATLFPADTSSTYTYGMKGTAYFNSYFPGTGSNPIVEGKLQIGLQVDFKTS